MRTPLASVEASQMIRMWMEKSAKSEFSLLGWRRIRGWQGASVLVIYTDRISWGGMRILARSAQGALECFDLSEMYRHGH